MKKIKETVISDFGDAVRIENFRLDKNGALIKRDGYTAVTGMGGIIRASLCVGGVTYVISGNSLYSVSGTAAAFIGTLSACSFASGEKAAMFADLGVLYIIGGGAYYAYDTFNGTLTEQIGYAPLIRINATSSSMGEEHEPRNLISKRVRMSFNPADSTSKTLSLWGTVTAVTAVWGNGVRYGTSSYRVSISTATSTVTIVSSTLFACKDITIEYELDTTAHPIMKSEYLSGCKAHVHREDKGKRLFLYGYASPSDTDGVVGIVRITGADADGALHTDYIPEDSYFTVGDGFEPVRCISTLGSRTVLMSENMIYELNSGSSFSCKVVTPEMGIGTCSGTVLYSDELYFMSDRGLYRFSYNAETFEYYAVRIDFADHALPKAGEYDRMNLFLYRKNDELWCCGDSCAYIYNLYRKKWYIFSGLSIDGMVACDDEAAFFSGSVLGVFSDGQYTDNGKGFEASFESKPLELDSFYKKKTLFGIGVCFDRYSSAAVMCTVTNDKGENAVIGFTEDGVGTVSPAVMRTKTRLAFANYLIFRITAPSGTVPLNVRSIMLRYRETGV